MKYVPPYGRESEGDSAQYVNGDPSIGRQGSIPPANAFEHPMREIVGVIGKSMVTPSDTDLLQMTKSVRSQRLNFADDTGSVNTLSVAYDPPIAAYTPGLLLRVRMRVTNTGACTIDAGAGRVGIRKMDGSVNNPSDLPAGGIIDLVYDGTNFQLVNFGGIVSPGPPSTILVKIPYVEDISDTPNIITAPFSPAITALNAGECILVKIKNTTTGPTTINVNALATRSVKARGTGGTMDITQGDMMAGDVVLFHWEPITAVWQMVPNTVITVDTTIQVPAQLPTVAAALNAIARKTISQTATVTIKLAAGIYPPFQILHAYSDRIVIDGTMLVPGVIPVGNFAVTGNTPAARSNDAATNINMLRSRFGTIVRLTPAYQGVNAIQNIGPGMPRISNILVEGAQYGYPGYDQNGVMVDFDRMISCYNVATWGLRCGFGQGGSFNCLNCYVCGCSSAGFLMSGPGQLTATNCIAVGNGAAGFYTNQNGLFRAGTCYSLSNASTGFESTENSYASTSGCTSTGNGTFDYSAGNVSVMVAFSPSYATSSPAAYTAGNNGSYFFPQ